jgi:poly-gamma-glutamate synthesis protein (capsule biosynthesis protein)
MDWGPDALVDTIELFRKKGIQTIGAGANEKEARTPAIFERNGVRVAMLAYCSIVNEGYAASPNKPGVAPLRAYTYYQPTEYQPGMPPRIVTFPYPEDLEAMTADIAAAKKNAHAVVVSMHWGLHFIPRVIAEYQPIAAKAAFAAGADLILGHHAHVPKAIGSYDEKVCFYSLSNFIMTTTSGVTPGRTAMFAKRYGVTLDPEFPNMPFGPDGRRSLIAKAVISGEGVKKVSFLPVLIDKQLRPEVLTGGDPRFDDAVKYMDWASEEFDHRFTIEGNEVVVTA